MWIAWAVVGHCGFVFYHYESLWVVVARCGSLWVLAVCSGRFIVLAVSILKEEVINFCKI